MDRIPRGKSIRAGIDPDARPAPNALTASERAEGFELLFDGRSLTGWKGFGRDAAPSRWAVVDDSLAVTPGGERGDVATVREYGDFDLRFDWRVAPGGNSGVFYRVSEDRGAAWETGPEMQVLDDDTHADGRDPRTSAGSLYGLIARAMPTVRPAPHWNRARIVARGSRVEHWLNGALVVQDDAAGDEFARLVAASKFARMAHFAKSLQGRIVLQDHGDPVQYRNLRIRRLD